MKIKGKQSSKLNIFDSIVRLQKSSLWKRGFLSLTAVVVFVTTYMLILPAITEESPTYCGIEAHTHSDECYEVTEKLICGLEDSAETHVHDDNCYITERELICEQEEITGHTHSEACYKKEQVLVCTETEEVHEHGDACYQLRKDLICTEEECEGHTHTASCYEESKVLLCTNTEEDHEHGEECYQEQTNLICAQEEREGHAHGEDCYEENRVLLCELSTEAGHTHTEDCYQEQNHLVCELEEQEGHMHGDDCYREKQTLSCDKEENLQTHVHTDECYEKKETLICEKEEHEHSLACYSNPNADIESSTTWEKTIARVELTGDWSEDVVAIAKTQLGYTESTANYEVDDAGKKKGYTRYGAWYGVPYGDWCAMFASFCYHYAGVDSKLVPLECGCENWFLKLSGKYDGNYAEYDLYHDATEVKDGSYSLKAGDLVFFNWDSQPDADHVGIIYQIKTETDEDENETITGFTTIEGNSGNCVKINSYELDYEKIMGYGELPINPEYTNPEELTEENIADTETESDSSGSYGDYNAEAYLVDPVATTVSPTRKLLKSAAAPAAMTLADGDGDTADKYDMSQYITTVNIQHRANDTDLWENITSGTVKAGDKLRFDISYELPAGTLDINNRTIHYQVPDNITITKAESGKVKDSSGNNIGHYVISTDGSISITFDEEYATKNANGSKINGHIAFESSVDNVGKDDDGNITLPFNEEIKLEVHDPYGDIKVEKTSYNVDHFNGKMSYKVEISSERGTAGNVVVKDTAYNIRPIDNTAQVVDKNGDSVSVVITDNGNTWTFPPLSAGGKYVVTYDAELWDFTKLYNNEAAEATNKVVATSTDSDGNPIQWESSVKDIFTRNIINKYGEIRDGETNLIHWTIKVNTVSAARVDLSGWTLSDDFNGHVLDPNKDVTIKPNPATGNGSVVTHLPYTFPQGSAITEYTFTYETEGDGTAVNNAVLTGPGGGSIGTGGVTAGRADIKKTAIGQDIIGTDADGNVLVEQNWHVDFKSTSYIVRPDLIDWIFSQDGADTKVFPNGGYWRIDDSLKHSNGQYYTQEQMRQNAESIAAGLAAAGYTGNYYIFATDSNTKNPWLVKRSDGSYSYFQNAEKWRTTISPGDDVVYTNFYVFLDSSWGPDATISFDVKSTINVGSQRVNKTGTNTVKAKSGDMEISSGANQVYSPTLIKYDFRKENRLSTAIMPTEYNYEDTGGGILQWGIQFTLPKDIDYTEDVIITETLPEGIHLQSFSMSGTKIYMVRFYGKSGVFGNGSNCALYPDGTYSNQAGFDISASGGIGTLTDRTNRSYVMRYEYGKYEGTNPGELKLIIPANLANKIKGNSFKFTLYGSITDFAFIEKSYTNVVDVTYKGDVIDATSQTQTVKKKLITKGADLLTEDKTIPYFVSFNTTAADLVEGSDTLEFTDNLSYKAPDNSNLNLMLEQSSVKVYKIKGNSSLNIDADEIATRITTEIQATADGSKQNEIVEQRIMMGELVDITSSCPYTYEETVTADGKNVNTLRMTVPDSERILIAYSYRASGSGKVTGLTNAASIHGQGSGGNATENQIDITVQQSTADAVLVGINVYKVDSKNYAVHLNGAKFKLEKWSGTVWEQVQTYETGGEKGFFNTGELQDNTAYRLTETEAPAGYEMKTPTVYEFYVKNTSSGAHAECKPTGFTGRALNNGDDIIIANDAFSVNVYKVDSQNHALRLKGAEFDLEKWDGSKWMKVNSYKTAGEEGTFAVESLEGNTAYRLVETKAPEKYDLNSAIIYEFYIPDSRTGAATECKPNGFTGTAIDSGRSITIENSLLSYSLPQTGSTGTTPYTVGGLLLTGTALVLYIFGVRRRRERRFD